MQATPAVVAVDDGPGRLGDEVDDLGGGGVRRAGHDDGSRRYARGVACLVKDLPIDGVHGDALRLGTERARGS